MKNRNIILAAVLAGLVAVCGLCILTLFSTFAVFGVSTSDIQFFDFAGQSAQVTESRTFESYENLVLLSDAGDVTVTAADISEIEVDMTKTGWASTESEAQRIAEDLKIIVEETGNTLTIKFDKPEEITIFGGSAGTDKIDFDIKVPANTSLDLQAHFGDMVVSGVEGEVILDTSFGDVTLKNIEAGSGNVRIDTSFGDVDVEDVSGRDVDVFSSNGDITLDQVSATQKMEVENQFGRIMIKDLEANAVEVRNSNGRVEITEGNVVESVTVSNSFGDVVVKGVSADGFVLSSSNGEISLDKAMGTLDLHSSFGDIRVINGVNATLNLSTSNGSINFSGSLDPSRDHFVETSFGNVDLEIPEDAAHDLDLETSFGNISSDIPVTLSGVLDESEWRGGINGGGSLLRVHTSNGDITIETLFTGE